MGNYVTATDEYGDGVERGGYVESLAFAFKRRLGVEVVPEAFWEIGRK